MNGLQYMRVLLIAVAVAVLPAPTLAATLLWGNADGSEQAQVQIVEGGAYAVPLATSAPAHITLDEDEEPDPCFIVTGTLYRIDPEDAEMRILVASDIPSNCGPPGLTADLAWPEAGSYELDIVFTEIIPQVNAGWRKYVYLLGEVAEAQAGSTVIETLHFTIEELVEEPECPDADAEGCYSNVLFLPGIEASRLYTSDGKAWEPGFFDDLNDLYSDQSGGSVRSDVHVKVGDVVDETPVGKNIYKSFIGEMNQLESGGFINDWTPVAYDWRLSLDQILSSGKEEDGTISYLEATSTPYVIQELRRLAASSKSGKVTIIAHSNGGLLAKRLTQVLGDEAATLIDKIILVASPQAGTPLAVAAGMHGYQQSLAGGLVVSAQSARTFATTSPMFYHLLPSERYFTYIDDPVISFDEDLGDWIGQYGDTIHSEEQLHNFLVDSYGRVDAKTGDINQPVQLYEPLLLDAEALHDDIDIWTPPAGIDVIQIAGWGVDSTVSGIDYTKDGDGIKPNPTFTVDGDGTVVVPSALWVGASESTNYWIDLYRYNRVGDRIINATLNKVDHANILETDDVIAILVDSITNSIGPIEEYSYLSLNAPASAERRLHFELHSPLTLDIYDANGNHTGVSTTTGEVVDGIPGTYYITFGEQQYIFADAGVSYTLALDGYDSGTFTLIITETEGDTAVSSITFADVPVSSSTVVTLNVPSDIEEIVELAVDEDGDGVVDFNVSEDGTIIEVPEPEEAQEQPVQQEETVAANGPPVASPSSAPAPATSASAGGEAFLSIAPTTTPMIATSSEIAVATTTAEVSQALSERVEREEREERGQRTQAQAVSPKPPKTLPVQEESIVVTQPVAEEQVAAAAQVTQGGLWKRFYRWIIAKIGTI
jgi:pimeloyl-ACP methyl ester carboxylesterase